MTEAFPKDPGAVKGSVRRDGDRGDAHDDVRDGHVHQVHAGVQPKVFGSEQNYYQICQHSYISQC